MLVKVDGPDEEGDRTQAARLHHRPAQTTPAVSSIRRFPSATTFSSRVPSSSPRAATTKKTQRAQARTRRYLGRLSQSSSLINGGSAFLHLKSSRAPCRDHKRADDHRGRVPSVGLGPDDQFRSAPAMAPSVSRPPVTTRRQTGRFRPRASIRISSWSRNCRTI